MSAAKDVDETILSQARVLLRYVRANGHPHMTIGSLAEVPWFLVLLFEFLIVENIPDEMKLFGTLEEQALTLQLILDTLEQTLRLPLNHITGMGLARLERRHISDALQVYSDLIKHCYSASKGKRDMGAPDTPEGRRLSMSQFESPEFEEVMLSSQRSTPKLSTLQKIGLNSPPEKHLGQDSLRPRVSESSPVMTVRPVPQSQQAHVGGHIPGREEHSTERSCVSVQSVEKEANFKSSKSSITLVKEVYRQRETAIDRPTRDRIDLELEGGRVNRPVEKSPQKHQIFAPRLPSMSLFSPSKSTKEAMLWQSIGKHTRDANGRDQFISPVKVKSPRYKPYEQPSRHYDLIEYPLTRRVAEQSRYRESSAKLPDKAKKPNDKYNKQVPSVQRSLCRKPSVKSFRSPKDSTRRRTPNVSQGRSSASARPNMKACHYNGSERDEVSRAQQRTKSGLRTSVRSTTTKEPEILSKSTRKPSVINSKTKPPVTGVGKKPPNYRSRKISVKGKGMSAGQKTCPRSRSGSVCSRRKADGPPDVSNHAISSSDTRENKNRYMQMPHDHVLSRRRPSVVSTKVRKHSLASPSSPEITVGRTSRHSRPVKRGDVSPQTTSLCSSLKLLEEIDYIKRRMKQIKMQKQEHREAICELEHEEVRLEYLMTHVQQQTTHALSKGTPGRVASRGAPV